jgi:RNA polymerase sigma-70 factor (ECF subfamily)
VVSAIAPRAQAIDPARRTRLEGMVARDYRLIWRLLRRLGLSPAAADDAAQQVYLIAAERLDDIHEGKERAFVYGTALRVAQGVRRKRDRETPGLDAHESELVARAPDPEQLVSQRRQREALDRILAELPLELRAVFVLFELEGLSSPEIAALSDLPLGTVASRLRRAREQFRELCRLQGETP